MYASWLAKYLNIALKKQLLWDILKVVGFQIVIQLIIARIILEIAQHELLLKLF